MKSDPKVPQPPKTASPSPILAKEKKGKANKQAAPAPTTPSLPPPISPAVSRTTKKAAGKSKEPIKKLAEKSPAIKPTAASILPTKTTVFEKAATPVKKKTPTAKLSAGTVWPTLSATATDLAPQKTTGKTKRTVTKPAIVQVAATTTSEPSVKTSIPVKTKTKTKTKTKVKAQTRLTAKTASPKKRRSSAKRPALVIPSILLEDDRPSPPPLSGPGQRYALGATPPVAHFAEMEDLPEAYGTKKLILTARDPHWLYAHWDFTQEQLQQNNARAADGHLILRVYANQLTGKPLTQAQVHPESRNWFIHVGQGGVKYVAELGYHTRQRKWVQLAVSGMTLTPPDTLSEDTSVRFATIPVDVPLADLVKIVKSSLREQAPLAEAIAQLRAEGFTQLPSANDIAQFRWTPAQEKALAEIISIDQVRRVWIGSLEITELLRRQLAEEMSSLGAAQLQRPSSLSLTSLSSPFGDVEKPKKFWFNINAELIIYGATEPDAAVRIGGRKIQLRPDGTFSYRFVLPDGNYDLPAQATSVDGEDTRCATLKFSRTTNYQGEVGAHPQDKNKKPPLVESLA